MHGKIRGLQFFPSIAAQRLPSSIALLGKFTGNRAAKLQKLQNCSCQVRKRPK
jgi:hypothetical protein